MNDNTINESSKTEDSDNKNDEIIAVRNSLEKRPDGVVRQTISNAIAVLNNEPTNMHCRGLSSGCVS